MLSSYFKRNTTLATFCNGPAGPYLDEFTDWLSKRGFQQETIRRRILGAVQFVDWTQATSVKWEDFTPVVMINYRQYLKERGQFSMPDKLMEMLRPGS